VAASHALPPPYVVKPIDEGSSVGVVIVGPGTNDWAKMILDGGPPDQIVMVERFIAGRELTCAVIGDFATDVIEIVPQKGLAFYDFEAKYAPGESEHERRPELPDQPIDPEIPGGSRLARVPWRVACGLPLRRYARWNG
jgi:D-alanine-D-alanine ligase